MGPLVEQFMQYCVAEFKKQDTKDKIFDEIVNPLLKDISARYYSYFIMVIITLVIIIVLLIAILTSIIKKKKKREN